ncbi:MAG TPA: LptF/LptG family permease [Chitinophagaceae bacterium]|nr:LptF/LptG family permease [Chitinophagaceae bacterium]
MKILDWYILKKYFLTFLFFLLALTAIAVIIDLSERTDDFAKTKLPALTILTQYYFGFIPRIDALLFPLFVFLSVIFFTSGLANRSEIIAILGNGISFPRFLRPYFIGGIILSAFLWWCNQSLLPKANAKWANFSAKYIDESYAGVRNQSFINNYYFRLDSFSYAGIRYYDTVSRTGNSFFVQTFRNNQLVYNLRSETITWDTLTNKWRLTGVMERYIDGIEENLKPHPVMQMEYNFKPMDLQRDEYMKDKLSTQELVDYIRLEKIRGSETVNSLSLEKNTRDAGPPSVLILTMIGAIVASKKIRGGSGIHLATGIVISVLYILISRFSSVFAMKGNFNPVLAAWLPNIFFAILAYYLYRRAPK